MRASTRLLKHPVCLPRAHGCTPLLPKVLKSPGSSGPGHKPSNARCPSHQSCGQGECEQFLQSFWLSMSVKCRKDHEPVADAFNTLRELKIKPFLDHQFHPI